MEEMRRARHVEGGAELPCPAWVPTLPAPPRVLQPRSSLNPILLGFYGSLITQAQLINSLVVGDNLQPVFIPRV